MARRQKCKLLYHIFPAAHIVWGLAPRQPMNCTLHLDYRSAVDSVVGTSPLPRLTRPALRNSAHVRAVQFWRTNITDNNGDTLEAAKEKLKERLLMLVRSTERGVSTSEEQRQDIDELIAALEPCENQLFNVLYLESLGGALQKASFACSLICVYWYINHSVASNGHITSHHTTPNPLPVAVNPNAKSVTSESLSALWILEWTTEREILFLMETGLPWKPSGPVQQEIDVDAKTLSNRMIFGDDSLFEVFSSIDPEVGAPVCFLFVWRARRVQQYSTHMPIRASTLILTSAVCALHVDARKGPHPSLTFIDVDLSRNTATMVNDARSCATNPVKS